MSKLMIDKQFVEEKAMSRLERFERILCSDLEIIDSMSLEETKEELCDIGIIYPVINTVELMKEPKAGSAPRIISEIERKIKMLFAAAEDEFFEDGMENEFTKGLSSLIRNYGQDAIAVLTHTIAYKDVNEEVASEALRWLTRLNHPSSYVERRWLVERCLQSPSVRIRDAALSGIASLNDPHSIPCFKEAMQGETCTELKEDMEQVLAQLESMHQCPSS